MSRMLNARGPRLAARVTVMLAAMAVGGVASVRALAAAAGPQLPASAVGAETFVVVQVNLAKVDGNAIDQTVGAVLGPMAGMVAGNPGMADFKAKLKDMTDAGAETLTIVASGDPTTGNGDTADGIAYVKLKGGADHAAAERKFREEEATQAAKHPGAKSEGTDVSFDGDYMVVRKKGLELPKGGDAERMKQFGAAMPVEGRAVEMVFIPTAKIREKMKAEMKPDPNQPAWMTASHQAITEAKVMTLGIALGAAPTIDVAVTAADADGAKKLVEGVTNGKQQLQAQAAAMQQGGPQGAAMANAFTTLANALNPKQAEDQVTMSIDVKAVAPAIQGVLPMILMGGGGGGPGGPSRPAGGGRPPGGL